jgi:hypothetical protein
VDLSRAKTILIISFLMLNIFLGLRLWYSPQYVRERGGLTAEEAELSRDLLQEAGYEVTAVVPRQIPRLYLLNVARPPVDKNFWPLKFWGDEPEIGAKSPEGAITFQKGNELLEIFPGGMVFFRKFVGNDATGEDSRPLVERFLRERGLFEDSLKFDLSFPRNGGTYVYRYLQTYQGFPLFSGHVEIQIGSDGISGAEIYYLEPLGFSNKEMRVISAVEAIKTMIQQPGEFTHKKIIEISLGYHSQHYNAERWEVAPVWRFAASDGSVFYVNAFTGEVEPVNM